MRKSLIFIAFALLATACYKDKGNYDYNAINEIGIQLAADYRVLLNDSLLITPQLSSSLGQSLDPTSYTYQWSILNGEKEEILGETRNLAIRVQSSPGTYPLRLRVKEQGSGLQWQQESTLLISSPVYEGYLVLSETAGSSRLDMLSYGDGVYTQLTDVLSLSGNPVPALGRPFKVYAMDINPWDQVYGIYLLTSSGTTRIDPETFAIGPLMDISYQFLGQLPVPFAPTGMDGVLAYDSAPMMWLFADGNIYHYSSFGSSSFSSLPVNVYPGQSRPFRASPYHISHWDAAVFYDEDAKRFATHVTPQFNSSPVLEFFEYPEGLELLHMEATYSGEGHAIMKDPVNGRYYWLQFVIGGEKTYFEEINIAGFENATHYAVSPEFGYLFYSVGGDVFQYDAYLKTSKRMVSQPGGEVTYLAFQQFPYRAINSRYAEWSNRLSIGTFSAAAPAGTGGKLSIYRVPPVNGQLEAVEQWEGFGKIVSITYRER